MHQQHRTEQNRTEKREGMNGCQEGWRRRGNCYLAIRVLSTHLFSRSSLFLWVLWVLWVCMFFTSFFSHSSFSSSRRGDIHSRLSHVESLRQMQCLPLCILYSAFCMSSWGNEWCTVDKERRGDLSLRSINWQLFFKNVRLEGHSSEGSMTASTDEIYVSWEKKDGKSCSLFVLGSSLRGNEKDGDGEMTMSRSRSCIVFSSQPLDRSENPFVLSFKFATSILASSLLWGVSRCFLADTHSTLHVSSSRGDLTLLSFLVWESSMNWWSQLSFTLV